jgi:hypothetical protein
MRVFRRAFRSAVVAMSLTAAGCHGNEDVRKRIAGKYVREIDARPTTNFVVRQVLTLRANGSWIKTTNVETLGVPRASPPDSGTYRVEGVQLALQSLVEPDGAPMRFTMSGDTLISANVAQGRAVSRYHVDEEIFARAR